MFTNDGNVILFNIHISTDQGMSLSFPTEKSELNGNAYAETLFEMSSLLPLRYNPEIAKMRAGSPEKRHSAMGVNTDGATLIKIMDIGTPTNISQNQCYRQNRREHPQRRRGAHRRQFYGCF